VEKCPRCRAKVLVGLDAEACAFTVTIDPAALTRDGELIYIVGGALMYALKPSGQILRRSHARESLNALDTSPFIENINVTSQRLRICSRRRNHQQ